MRRSSPVPPGSSAATTSAQRPSGSWKSKLRREVGIEREQLGIAPHFGPHRLAIGTQRSEQTAGSQGVGDQERTARALFAHLDQEGARAILRLDIDASFPSPSTNGQSDAISGRPRSDEVARRIPRVGGHA